MRKTFTGPRCCADAWNRESHPPRRSSKRIEISRDSARDTRISEAAWIFKRPPNEVHARLTWQAHIAVESERPVPHNFTVQTVQGPMLCHVTRYSLHPVLVRTDRGCLCVAAYVRTTASIAGAGTHACKRADTHTHTHTHRRASTAPTPNTGMWRHSRTWPDALLRCLPFPTGRHRLALSLPLPLPLSPGFFLPCPSPFPDPRPPLLRPPSPLRGGAYAARYARVPCTPRCPAAPTASPP